MRTVTIAFTDQMLDRIFFREDPIGPGTYSDHGTGRRFVGGIDQMHAALEIVMSDLRESVRTTAARGRDAAQTSFTALMQFINHKIADLGEKGTEFKNRLSERINGILQEIQEVLFATLSSTIMIGGFKYRMDSVEIVHSLKISGDLQVSLSVLCKFATEGQITMKGGYKLADS